MATTTTKKEVGREIAKKGSNSSSNPNHITKKQPSSSSMDQRKPFSTSTSRPVPNYLKPTINSSRTIPRKPVSPATSSATSSAMSSPKASLERRRSLDTNLKTPRSTSTLSSSTRGPQRSMSTLSSRSAKPAVTPSIRRSLSTWAPPSTSGIGLRRALKKPGSKSVVSDSTVEIEARDKDPLDEMIGSQDDQDEVLSLPEISEMPSQEETLGDPLIIEQQHVAQIEEVEKAVAAADDDDQELITEAVPDEKVEEQSEEEKHVVVELEESKEEEEEKEVVVVVKDESHAKEEEEKEVVVVVKDESHAKHEIITQSGNKKEVHDYNGVIEETASKLREKRNKVRALAGAFETVISLQDSKEKK